MNAETQADPQAKAANERLALDMALLLTAQFREEGMTLGVAANEAEWQLSHVPTLKIDDWVPIAEEVIRRQGGVL